MSPGSGIRPSCRIRASARPRDSSRRARPPTSAWCSEVEADASAATVGGAPRFLRRARARRVPGRLHLVGRAAVARRRPATGRGAALGLCVERLRQRLRALAELSRVESAVVAATASSVRSSTTSPSLSPAFSAGLPFITPLTRAPFRSFTPNSSARSEVTSWMLTPSQPRTTFPLLIRLSMTDLTMFAGTAKPIP